MFIKILAEPVTRCPACVQFLIYALLKNVEKLKMTPTVISLVLLVQIHDDIIFLFIIHMHEQISFPI